MKILAIVGSPRPGGNTSFLVDQALERAAAGGCEIEKIILARYRVNPCLGHDRCASLTACVQKDDAPAILEKFRTADGVILATPVYYYNMSAQMKAFIDRNYFLYTHAIPLKARVMGLIVVAGSEGIDYTVRALKRCFTLAGESPESVFTVTGCAMRLGEAKAHPALVEQAQTLGKKMAERLGRG